jgi:hypothetical protein
MAQWMGLPVVSALLQSAVASGLPVRRSFERTRMADNFTSGHCWETGRRAVAATGTAAGQTRRLFTCKKLLFAFPQALPTSVPGLIVSALP